jgi:hypothetical protein
VFTGRPEIRLRPVRPDSNKTSTSTAEKRYSPHFAHRALLLIGSWCGTGWLSVITSYRKRCARGPHNGRRAPEAHPQEGTPGGGPRTGGQNLPTGVPSCRVGELRWGRGAYGIVTRHPGFVAGAWAGETDAVAPPMAPDRVHFCSGGTGGSAGGPSSRTRGHSADRSSIPHTGCVLGLCDGDLSRVLGDSWRSSAVHGGRGRALFRPGHLIDHRC